MFAAAQMDPVLQFAFFLVAIILFVLAAFNVPARVGLLALGLASFAVPFAWNALAAA